MTAPTLKSPYSMRRLAHIEATGSLPHGCTSCREHLVKSFTDAGWIAFEDSPEHGRRFVLTDQGREALEGWRTQEEVRL